MGIRAIAVYSEADANALHVREADAAIAIGPAPAHESYLVGEKIIAAAKAAGAEAIHPGYGFLSENEVFAADVIEAGLVWIGPRPASIRAMGLKDAAKKLMANAGVPVTPGYLGDDQSDARLAQEAEAIGYPVLIKAVAGGGGKGMRKVDAAKQFKDALGAARREAKAAFGDDRVLLETYVQRPRHIEVQIFGDTHGNIVHLFERDCSLQRRHQKVIEEAPAPGMDEETRAAICAAAVRAGEAVNYEGAGTVEFIADASEGLRADRIWFMEMNTRLQVEHPVTEAVTGLDLVEWQIRVASGEKLPRTQQEIKLNGCAVEARLYAENPETGFLPSTGPLRHFVLPETVRVDTGVAPGDAISPHYDPMIAKLIAHAPTREAAAAALAAACADVEIWPVKTNAAFLARALEAPDFLVGSIDTGFIERQLDVLTAHRPPSAELLAAAAALLIERTQSPGPWGELAGFRLNAAPQTSIRLEEAGELFDAELGGADAHFAALAFEDRAIVFANGQAREFALPQAASAAGEAAGDGAIRSPMPGKIVAVAAKNGDSVKKGDPILTLEAMKMEHVLTAPFDGAVAALSAKPGDQVSEGVVLARLEKADA